MIHWALWFSIYMLQHDFLSFLFDLSQQKITSLSPKHFSITPFIFPIHPLVWSLHFYSGMIFFLSFYHTFHALWPNFWVFFFFFFWKFLGFFKIDEVFLKFLGWFLFKWSTMFMHCITFAFLTMFMNFRCVFTLLQWCVLVGLDWAKPMMFLSLHVTCSCIFHAYVPSFIFILILICVGTILHVCSSLPFFRLVALWHLKENPLHPKTLFVLGHLPLHFLTPLLLTYDSVMISS